MNNESLSLFSLASFEAAIGLVDSIRCRGIVGQHRLQLGLKAIEALQQGGVSASILTRSPAANSLPVGPFNCEPGPSVNRDQCYSAGLSKGPIRFVLKRC